MQKPEFQSSRQLVGEKKRKKCEQILGGHVLAAFVNGDLPHGIAVAYVGEYDAYLVNLKTKTSIQYICDGGLILTKVLVIKYRQKEKHDNLHKSNSQG